MKKLYSFLLILVLGIQPYAKVFAQRQIPEDNLSYPILITLQIAPKSQSFGSGFFFNAAEGSYLVTAKHVLFGEKSGNLKSEFATLVAYPRLPSDLGKNVIKLNLSSLQRSGHLKYSSRHDVAIVRVTTNTQENDTFKVAIALSGVEFIEKAKSGLLGVGPNTIKNYEEVIIGNDVFVFGYPISLGLKKLPVQIDYERPLLRKGIVAGKNDKLRTLIIDAPIFGGNSGGPVLEVERTFAGTRYRVIGLVTNFVPSIETWENKEHGYSNMFVSNSGYSVVRPMDTVLELINSNVKTVK